MKAFLKYVIIFSLLHLVLLLTSILVSYTLGIDRFENGIVDESALESVTGTLSGILGFPGTYLWTPWATKNLSNFIEWFVFAANSVVWGIVLAYLYAFIKKHTSGLPG